MVLRTAAKRQTTFRLAAWLVATALLAIALLGPTASAALADHDPPIKVEDVTLGTGFDNPCGDGEVAVKINSGDLVAGTHEYEFGDTGIVIELTTVLGEGNAIDSVTVGSISGGTIVTIHVHAGEGTTLQVVPGTIVDPDKDISFILFCVGDEVVTTTTSTTGTTTTETTTTETTTETTTTDTTTETTTATTTETTTETTTTGGVSPTTTTGTVSGTTSTGSITLPPTSTVDGDGSNHSALISFGLLLVAVGAFALGLAHPLATRRINRR